MKIQIQSIAEFHLILIFGDRIESELTAQIAAACHYIHNNFADQIIEVVPSYTSILLELHPLRSDPDALKQSLTVQLSQLDQHADLSGSLIELPVYYSNETGPDLAGLARLHSLDPSEVIARHCGQEYQVCAIGFAPGFAFLASVDASIATPRHTTPRLKIPAGSVGIANQQTAVYPASSPGGWQIIGNCPVPLFDPTQQPMMPFSIGDRVRFVPIERDKFLAMGGEICTDWK